MYIGGRDIRSSPHPLTYIVSEWGDLHRMYRSNRTAHAQIVMESVAFQSVQWNTQTTCTDRSPTCTMDTRAPTLESKKNAGTVAKKKNELSLAFFGKKMN